MYTALMDDELVAVLLRRTDLRPHGRFDLARNLLREPHVQLRHGATVGHPRRDRVDDHTGRLELARMPVELGVDQRLAPALGGRLRAQRRTAVAAPAEPGDAEFPAGREVCAHGAGVL